MLKKLDFGGAAVVVTAAGAGIGEATCAELAELGALVRAVDIDPLIGERVADTPERYGKAARGYVADVSSEEAIRGLADQVRQESPHIAAVVNVAGVNDFTPAHELELDVWNRVININLTSVFLMVREFVPDLRQRGGSVVNVASTYGLVGAKNMPAYCASKAGVVNLTRQLATDLAEFGIRVNSVCPGPTLTPRRKAHFDSGLRDQQAAVRRTAMQRMADPSEIGSVIAFLASPAASYMTGATVAVDGGQLAYAGAFD